MKVKTKQKEAEIADRYGEDYFRSKERIDALLGIQETHKEVIKKFAKKADSKIEQGKETLVFGNKFAVGFMNTDIPMTIDYKQLFKLRPDLEKLVCRLMPDEELVKKLVKSGKITKQLLAKCLTPCGKAQERVVVKDLSKKKGE